MRTQDEIIQRMQDREGIDMFGVETTDYIEYLSYDNAKEYLKEGVTEADWPKPNPPEEKMAEYMKFAFDKAHGERGLSANRSIMHMIAWSWLLGDEQFNQEIERMYEEEYRNYGLDILRYICTTLGISPEEHGDRR